MGKWSDHGQQTLRIKEQGGKVKEYDLDDFVGVSVSRERVKQALAEQPAKFAYVASLQAAAIVLAERLGERLGFVKAELDGEIRREAEAAEIKMTEGKIDSMIKTHKRYRAALEEYQSAREQEESLKAIRDSLKQRLDCLVAFANNFRLELDTDPGNRVGAPKPMREKA